MASLASIMGSSLLLHRSKLMAGGLSGEASRRFEAPKTAASLRSSRRQHGQIAITIILVLPVLIGAMSLVCDVLVLYVNWVLLQNAADHSAVAGASRPDLAMLYANQYAATNSIAASEIMSITISNTNKKLNVQLRRTVPYSFAVLVGLRSGTVSAQATAQIQTVGSVIGVTPIGIDYRVAYTAGQVVQLVQGVGPGNWQFLAMGGSGASNLIQNIEYGYSGTISMDNQISTEPGQKVGPVKGAFDYLINQGRSFDAGGTFANHKPGDPRVLIVPMVDFSSPNGSSLVPVKGFPALWLVSVDGNSNISSYFIDQVAAGSTPDPNAGSYGAYKAVLIQ
jgi:Flp pilus assembly protein TadG